MPKLGMEPIRRAALVEAAIAEIGAAGNLDVSVSRIAKRAGMSSALAHHYFGGKNQILLAAMRHALTLYGRGVLNALRGRTDPIERITAVVSAGFTPENFRPQVISAWLNFYVMAQTDREAQRLLRIYHRRLHSNLVHDLTPLLGRRADTAATRIAGLIDGLYLRQALLQETSGSTGAHALVLDQLSLEIKGAAQ